METCYEIVFGWNKMWVLYVRGIIENADVYFSVMLLKWAAEALVWKPYLYILQYYIQNKTSAEY